MADDIYKLVQQALAAEQGSARNQFYDPVVDIALQIPSMIQGQKDRKEYLQMERFKDQQYVSNQFTDTISRLMSVAQNPDGTMSSDSIGNIRGKIDKLKFEYEKQFPNSIELIGMTGDMINSKLSKMEEDNVRYDNINFEMNKLMGDGPGTLNSLLDKYSNLTEEDVLNNREELVNELSQMTSSIGGYNENFNNSGFNTRTGSSKIISNMNKANFTIKALQQQLLDIDSRSPKKIFTDRERIGFEQFIENDNKDFIDDIIEENKQNITNKKKQAFEAIERHVSDYAEAKNILSLSINKNNIINDYVLLDLDGNETGLKASEWEFKKVNAIDELEVGKYDEKLKNLYASGFGYMDLYSDRPAAQVIRNSENLQGFFGDKGEKLPENINPNVNNIPEDANKKDNIQNNIIVDEPEKIIVDKPEKVSVDVQEFLDFPIQKGTSNAPSTDKLKEWKANLKETTGWSKRNIETAARKLKSIYKDNIRLNKFTPQQANQKEQLQKRINEKVSDFEGWLNSPSLMDMIKMPKFSETLKKMPLEELKSQASLQLKGTGDSSWNNSIRAAREELKRRTNSSEQEEFIKNEWANMSQSQKDNLGVKTYKEFANLALLKAEDKLN